MANYQAPYLQVLPPNATYRRTTVQAPGASRQGLSQDLAVPLRKPYNSFCGDGVEPQPCFPVCCCSRRTGNPWPNQRGGCTGHLCRHGCHFMVSCILMLVPAMAHLLSTITMPWIANLRSGMHTVFFPTPISREAAPEGYRKPYS